MICIWIIALIDQLYILIYIHVPVSSFEYLMKFMVYNVIYALESGGLCHCRRSNSSVGIYRSNFA